MASCFLLNYRNKKFQETVEKLVQVKSIFKLGRVLINFILNSCFHHWSWTIHNEEPINCGEHQWHCNYGKYRTSNWVKYGLAYTSGRNSKTFLVSLKGKIWTIMAPISVAMPGYACLVFYGAKFKERKKPPEIGPFLKMMLLVQNKCIPST